jgi:hypothetical protein
MSREEQRPFIRLNSAQSDIFMIRIVHINWSLEEEITAFMAIRIAFEYFAERELKKWSFLELSLF